MSTDLAICSTDRRSRPAEEERERGVYGGGEGGGFMRWRRSRDDGGRKKPESRVAAAGVRMAGIGRTGSTAGRAGCEGTWVGCTPRTILQFG